MNSKDDFASLGEELYEDNNVILPEFFMPNPPTGPIFRTVPTGPILPTPIVSSRDEIVKLRNSAYDKYVDVMHKTLQGFSKLNCRRTKEINDGVQKIKNLINDINMYDERLKSMGGGKKKRKDKKSITRRIKKRKHRKTRK
jgi:hypothetical protein